MPRKWLTSIVVRGNLEHGVDWQSGNASRADFVENRAVSRLQGRVAVVRVPYRLALPFHVASHTLADPMKERVQFDRGWWWFHAPKTHPALRGWRKLLFGVDDTDIIAVVLTKPT